MELTIACLCMLIPIGIYPIITVSAIKKAMRDTDYFVEQLLLTIINFFIAFFISLNFISYSKQGEVIFVAVITYGMITGSSVMFLRMLKRIHDGKDVLIYIIYFVILAILIWLSFMQHL